MTRATRANLAAWASLASLALSAADASAQGVPAAARPEYFRAYGIVAGRVNAVEAVHSVCVDRVPATASAQLAAMAAWRARHRELLRLVDEQPAIMAIDNEALPPADRIDVQRIAEGRARLREQTRRALERDPERLRVGCAEYLLALDDPAMALEAVFAAEIAIIRRGPLGTRGEAPATACPGPELGAGCGPSDVDRSQRGGNGAPRASPASSAPSASSSPR